MIRKSKNLSEDSFLMGKKISSKQATKESKAENSIAFTSRVDSGKVSHRDNLHLHQLQATVPFQDQWEVTESRREHFLNSLFNRRKAVLESISKKNKEIYLRITNQESHYLHLQTEKQSSNTADKITMENSTSNSRFMLEFSRNAFNQSKHALGNRILPIKNKENSLDAVHSTTIEMISRKIQLPPIAQHKSTLDPIPCLKITQSRYQRQDLISSDSVQSNNRPRNRKTYRGKLADVYLNF